MMDENCIFCKIVNKEIPSTMVYEDEYVCAFKDLHPVAPVHVLVIPKVHIKDLESINEENVIYVSGSSPSVFKSFIGALNGETAYDVMLKTLNDKMYDCVQI